MMDHDYAYTSEPQAGQVYESQYDIPTYGRMIIINAGHFETVLKKYGAELAEIGAYHVMVKKKSLSTIKIATEGATEELLVIPADNLAQWLVKKVNVGGITDTLLFLALAIAEALSAEPVASVITKQLASRVDAETVGAVFSALTLQLRHYAHIDKILEVAKLSIDSNRLDTAQESIDSFALRMQFLSTQYQAVYLFLLTLGNYMEEDKFSIPLESRREVLEEFLQLREVVAGLQEVMNHQVEYAERIKEYENQILLKRKGS